MFVRSLAGTNNISAILNLCYALRGFAAASNSCNKAEVLQTHFVLDHVLRLHHEMDNKFFVTRLSLR